MLPTIQTQRSFAKKTHISLRLHEYVVLATPIYAMLSRTCSLNTAIFIINIFFSVRLAALELAQSVDLLENHLHHPLRLHIVFLTASWLKAVF